jgi:hypothetical protein
MSRPPQSPVFLERASYKQRRVKDAARLLPVLGIVLWGIPLLWQSDSTENTSNADALIYVFGVWVLLIGLSALIIQKMDTDEVPSQPDASD